LHAVPASGNDRHAMADFCWRHRRAYADDPSSEGSDAADGENVTLLPTFGPVLSTFVTHPWHSTRWFNKKPVCTKR